jgi:replicative DNA helicase
MSATALPPHNLEAEKSVLGAVLLDDRYLITLALEEKLREEHFYREQHRLVYGAMLKLQSEGRQIDHLTVTEMLRQDGRLERAGGAGLVEELAGWVPAAGHAREYGRIVRENAQLRGLLSAAYEIQAGVAERRGGGEELIEEAERLIFALRSSDLGNRQRLLEQAVSDEIERLEQAAQQKREIPGLATGIGELDRVLGGLQKGRLYVLAARPAMGKSLLAQQVGRHAATRERARVLFASLEMSESETAQRHLAAESGVDPERIHLGKVKDGDWPALLRAAGESIGVPFHLIDDGDLSLLKLRAQARQIAVRHGELGLVIVDYLQLMRAERPSGSRVEDVSEFSRGLKRIARELDCPVIAVAQLSRAVEQRPDKRPVLSDLRESGQIEADSDCVLMLYREDYYDRDSDRPGEMEIIIRKNRQGRLGQITTRVDGRLRFLPVCTQGAGPQPSPQLGPQCKC